MFVDAHVSLDSRRFTVERAIEILHSANIQSAVVFADAEAEDLDLQNEYVLRVAQEHDLFPFYYLGGNPYTDTRPDELLLPDNLADYAGIRWHRWIGEAVDVRGELDAAELEWAVNLMEGPEFEAMVSAAAHYELPVLFEESFSVTFEAVTRFPSIDIIIPHLGARSGGETNVLRAFWDVPHVYFDTSLAAVDEAMLGRIGVERILFGSGLPHGDPDAELEKIERLPLSDEEKEAIYGDNLVRLLGRSES